MAPTTSPEPNIDFTKTAADRDDAASRQRLANHNRLSRRRLEPRRSRVGEPAHQTGVRARLRTSLQRRRALQGILAARRAFVEMLAASVSSWSGHISHEHEFQETLARSE